MDKHSSQLTLEELMQGAPQGYSASQLDLLKTAVKYEQNEPEWQTILESVVYDERENAIKFDLWYLL